jgi:hypothetical protein
MSGTPKTDTLEKNWFPRFVTILDAFKLCRELERRCACFEASFQYELKSNIRLEKQIKRLRDDAIRLRDLLGDKILHCHRCGKRSFASDCVGEGSLRCPCCPEHTDDHASLSDPSTWEGER